MYIFGGDTGKSYADLQRQRAIVDALQQQAFQPAHTGIPGAIEQIGKALIAKRKDKKVSAGEEKARSSAKEAIARLLGGSKPPSLDYSALLADDTSPMTGGDIASGPINPTPSDPNYVAPEDRSNWGSRLMGDLQAELGLPAHQAAGIVGNLAHETGDFAHLQELNPVVKGSRGGGGIAQWTGPRRRQFEAWAQQNGLDPKSYEANKGFLMHELTQTPEGRVLDRMRSTEDAAEAAQVFSEGFLRPGIPHMQSRISRASQYAGGDYPSVQMASNGGMEDALAILDNPYASDAQRAIAGQVIQRSMAQPEGLSAWQKAQLDLRRQEMDMRRRGEWSPGTNVNVNTGDTGPRVGSIPQGYQLVTDPGSNTHRMEVIPGGPADTTANEAAKEAAQQQTENIVSEEVGRALDLLETDGNWAAGIGSVLSSVPGTSAKTLDGMLKTIRGAVARDTLQAMRDSSPTGGALGAVSERELSMLESAMGNLEQSQNPEELARNLKRVNDIYLGIVHGGGGQESAPSGADDPLGLFQ